MAPPSPPTKRSADLERVDLMRAVMGDPKLRGTFIQAMGGNYQSVGSSALFALHEELALLSQYCFSLYDGTSEQEAGKLLDVIYDLTGYLHTMSERAEGAAEIAKYEMLPPLVGSGAREVVR